MFIKYKYTTFITLFFCFITFSSQLHSITIEDLTVASEVRSYCLPKNIHKTPLDVKLEQMLFLGWNKDSINSITVKYLGKHHIGGIYLNTQLNKHSEKLLQDFLRQLSTNYSIPTFIYVNNSNLNSNTYDIKENSGNFDKLKYLGINTIRISIKNGNKIPESLNNVTDKDFYPIFQFVKDSNKYNIVTIVDDFKVNLTSTNLNIYSLLVNVGKFNQIIIPYNGIVESIDPVNYYSLSQQAIKVGIRKNLNFCGVIVNSILSESNILKKISLEEVIVKAIKADNNMIFYNGKNLRLNQKFVEDFKSIVKSALKSGKLTVSDIDNAYKNIINLKSQFYIIPKENFC